MACRGPRTTLDSFAIAAGAAGAAVIAVASVATALVHRGSHGEPCSSLDNFFVSELDEAGASAGAALFDMGLVVVGGFAFVLSMVDAKGSRRGCRRHGMRAGSWYDPPYVATRAGCDG